MNYPNPILYLRTEIIGEWRNWEDPKFEPFVDLRMRIVKYFPALHYYSFFNPSHFL